MNWKNLLCGLALAFCLVPASSVLLYSQSPYYQGKTVTILVSTDAGGTADLRIKALAFISRNTFREIQRSLRNTCRVAAGERPPTTSIDRCGPTA